MALNYHWQIAGNETVLKRLEDDFENRRVGHAYLFSGAMQLGKFTAARRFAQLLQCEHENMCLHCTSCRLIESKGHLDTLQYNDLGESLKIDQIREAIKYLSISRQSRYKILIMKDIERMSIEASNALLKTLEEPVTGVVILLTTKEIGSILPTLLSRCRIVLFRTLNDSDLLSLLKERYPDFAEDRLKRIVTFALGRPGKALLLLNDQNILNCYEDVYFQVQDFLNVGSLYKKFAFVEEMADSDAQMEIFMDVTMHMLRNYLFNKYGLGYAIEEMRLTRHSVADLVDLIRRLIDAQAMLKFNINRRLLLENIMLQF